MKIDRAGYPVHRRRARAGRGPRRARRRYGWRAGVRRAGRVLRLFLPRSRAAGPAGRRPRRVARRRPRDDRRAERRRAGRRPGDWKQITIFLSPMDVHMNRTPVAGRVTRIEYRPGKFLPAYNEGSNDNELNEIWIDHDGRTDRRSARSSASWRGASSAASRRADSSSAGERIGLMKFGSRMDVFLPTRRASCAFRSAPQVVGGETVLGDAAGAPVLDSLPLRAAAGDDRGTGSGAACSCCRRCSRSRTCSAATPASSTPRAADFDTAALLHRDRDGARHARRLLRAPDQLVDRRSASSSIRWPTSCRSAWRRRSSRSRGACGRSSRLGWAAGFIYRHRRRDAPGALQHPDRARPTDKRYFVGHAEPRGRRR